MRALLSCAALAIFPALFCLCPPAEANCNGGAETCRTVVVSIDYLRDTDTTSNSAYAAVSVTCYHTTTSPDAICAGGGDFDRVLYSLGDSICGLVSGLDNGVTLIQDKVGNCFFRKNFGLNGVVDARQCGVWGDGAEKHTVRINGTDIDYYDIDLLNHCMAAIAEINKATVQNSPAVVSTGGGVIVSNKADVQIPANTTLDCGGNMGSAGDNDFRITANNQSGTAVPNLTHAIVLDPTNANGGPYTVTFTGKNGALKNCTLVAGGGRPAGSVYPNPYSPSIWYPDCLPDSTAVPCDTGTDEDEPKVHFRSSIFEQNAFTHIPAFPNGTAPFLSPAAQSIGITVANQNVTISNVTVLGFGTCLELGFQNDAAPSPVVEHLQGDCGAGIRIVTSDGPSFNDVKIDNSLTAGEKAFEIQGSSGIAWTGSAYTVTVTRDDSDFQIAPGDTVWVTPQAGHGAESAKGYWLAGSDASCTGTACTFSLVGSVNAVHEQATFSSAASNGAPANALTGIGITDGKLRFVQAGQAIEDTDNESCFPDWHTPATASRVSQVWAAIGVVYVSVPPTCNSTAMGGDHLIFHDTAYMTGEDDNCPVDNPGTPSAFFGCVTVDSNFRWGDGIHIENSGGAFFVNCHMFEHLISYHMYDGTRTADFTNCATGNHNDLPDRNLAALIAPDYPSGNVIGLLIDGSHNHGGEEQSNETDACETNWTNNAFGQHRSIDVVVQSDCNTPNRIVNASIGGGSGDNPGIDLELDAGGVSLANAEGGGGSPVLKAEKAPLYSYSPSTGFQLEGTYSANLKISNNDLPSSTLYLQNSNAAASTVGCGNIFANPTPYLCAPSSFTQPPGGRLTLIQGQPIMQGSVQNATQIYYSPYRSQAVPIYNVNTGAFGLFDIAVSGLTLKLDSSVQLSSLLYDIYAVSLDSNTVQLCSGPSWVNASGGALMRGASGQIAQVNGVWVNSGPITCHYHVNAGTVGDAMCQPHQCTYLGSAYMTAAGQTSQQFGPVAGIGGGGNCLCLYNAYNHVTVTSKSRDSGLPYAYTSPTWERQRGSGNNGITAIDGLGDMQISTQLSDAMTNGAGTTGYVLAVGIDYLFPGASVPAPVPIVQANSASKGTYSTTVTSNPIMGIWIAQAVEAAIGGSSGTSLFGGSGYQQISVQVAD